MCLQLLHAIQDFGINLDGYIHLLLPPIMQILDQSGVDTEVKMYVQGLLALFYLHCVYFFSWIQN